MNLFKSTKVNFEKIVSAFEAQKTIFPDFFQNQKELSNLTGSWFLGPKFENSEIFERAIRMAIESNGDYRQLYHPEDPEYVSDKLKKTPEYKDDITDFFFELGKFLTALKVSTPFYSYRSLGHMNWEISIPAMVGYFAAMLYNQNNVALEASPATTAMERSVANDLCTMLGLVPNLKTETKPWGHITCDGSIANIESVWVARNLKFYPMAFQLLIKNNSKLEKAKNIELTIQGISKKIGELSSWEILNIDSDEALLLPKKVLAIYPEITDEELNDWLKPYLIQEIGILEFYLKYLNTTNPPVVIGPASAHYSWPKACAIAGIGAQSFIHVPLDNYARQDITKLEEILYNCLKNKIPVMEVVGVIGTTEEGAIDNFSEIINLKNKFSKLGLKFHVHADAAWGGYFSSILQGQRIVNKNVPGFVPNLPLSNYTTQQFQSLAFADTITIDPHKAGYVPYPAGALCYKNSALKNLISFIPSYIDHGSNDPSMGLFGIEGSKPGAAAASVFLSHKVMPPNVNGIGKVLGESLFSAKYFYALLVGFQHPKFICIPIVNPEKNSIKIVNDNILGKTNHEILDNQIAMDWLTQNGQDTTIVSYFFNFRNNNGSVNTDLNLMNKLNNNLYEILSIPPGSSIEDIQKNPLFVTSSEFDVDTYGERFIKNQLDKAGICGEPAALSFLISTIMCPWITATEKGNYFDVIMTNIIEALEKAYLQLNQN